MNTDEIIKVLCIAMLFLALAFGEVKGFNALISSLVPKPPSQECLGGDLRSC